MTMIFFAEIAAVKPKLFPKLTLNRNHEQGTGEAVSEGGIKKFDKKKTILLISGISGIAVAAIIGFILLITAIFGGSGAEGALDNYLSVMQNPTDENIEKMAPEEYWEYLVNGLYNNYEDADEALEYAVDIYEDSLKTYERDYGNNIRFIFKTNKEEEANESIFESAKDFMTYKYDISEKDIKKMVKFSVLITIKGDEDELWYSRDLYSIQVRDDWYIINKKGEFTGVDDLEYRNNRSN